MKSKHPDIIIHSQSKLYYCICRNVNYIGVDMKYMFMGCICRDKR